MFLGELPNPPCCLPASPCPWEFHVQRRLQLSIGSSKSKAAGGSCSSLRCHGQHRASWTSEAVLQGVEGRINIFFLPQKISRLDHSTPPLLILSPDVARTCASGAASLGGAEKRVMRRGDMLNFPPRWCSHENISPADGVHVSLPSHWSSVTRQDVVRACVHLLFPEPSLPFWGGRGACPSVVSLRKTLCQ